MKYCRILPSLSAAVATLLLLSSGTLSAVEDEALGKSETFSEGAKLEAPETAATGERISIKWTGPGGKEDFIAIVAPDSEPDDFGVFAKTSAGNPVRIEAPDKVGKYEIRYVAGGDKVLASRVLTLAKPTASVKENAPLVMGGTVEVQWTGPNEKGDFIAIVLAGSEGSDLGGKTLTKKGNPAKVEVPTEPGLYEIRYVRGSDSKILASTEATVLTPERERQIEQGVAD